LLFDRFDPLSFAPFWKQKVLSWGKRNKQNDSSKEIWFGCAWSFTMWRNTCRHLKLLKNRRDPMITSIWRIRP
jgi:hypothetical protein